MNGFGITTEKPLRNYGDNRDVLEEFLLKEHESGRHAILVIDDDDHAAVADVAGGLFDGSKRHFHQT